MEAPHQRHVLEMGPAPVRGPDCQLMLEIPRRIRVYVICIENSELMSKVAYRMSRYVI